MGLTYRPHSSSCWGLAYRILNMNPQKELLWGLWVATKGLNLVITRELLVKTAVGALIADFAESFLLLQVPMLQDSDDDHDC